MTPTDPRDSSEMQQVRDRLPYGIDLTDEQLQPYIDHGKAAAQLSRRWWVECAVDLVLVAWDSPAAGQKERGSDA